MNKQLVVGISIFAGLALTGTIWYLMDKSKREKEDLENKLAEKANELAMATAAANSKPTSSSVPAKPSPPLPKSAALPSTPKIGTKLFVNSAKGLTVYTKPAASVSNILWYDLKGQKTAKFLNNGQYIGTFLAKEGIYYKVLVEITGTFGNSYVNGYVMENQVKI